MAMVDRDSSGANDFASSNGAATDFAVASASNGTTSRYNIDDVQNNEGAHREDLLRDGCCPHCGTQLYVTKRTGVMRKKVTKPLTIPGKVIRGQCLKCIQGNTTTEEEQANIAAAIALSAMQEEDEDNGGEEQHHPTAAAIPLTTVTPTQLEATYNGEHNQYGERHGKGELYWSNGDFYKGDFCNGVREGEGVLSFQDGSEYVGSWMNNFMHGEGTRRFPDGNVYTGHYDNGHRSGQGRCYYANGDMYVGEWKNDCMTGFGRYYYNNGQSFEGFFVQGKRNGRGKYQLTDGRVDIYRYENDKRVGQGVRWSANRKKAWRLQDGKIKGKISLREASEIAANCGEDGNQTQLDNEDENVDALL